MIFKKKQIYWKSQWSIGAICLDSGIRVLDFAFFNFARLGIDLEALDEGDGTGGGLIALDAGLLNEKRGNRAMDDLWIKSSCVSSQNNGDTDTLGWDTSL